LKLTTDRLVKFVPAIVMLVSFEPARTDMGDIDESVGTGLLAAETVKLTGTDEPPLGAGLVTTTG
jgi:hypothetical protein